MCLNFVSVVLDRIKLGGNKVVGTDLSVGNVEVTGFGELEDGIEEVKESSLGVKLVPVGVSNGDFSNSVLYGNEDIEVSEQVVFLVTVVLSDKGISNDLLDVSEDKNIEISELG